MKISINVKTDKGLKRLNNEDSYSVIKQNGLYAMAVCDGIGGRPGGEKASAIASETFTQYFSDIRLIACSYGKAVKKKVRRNRSADSLETIKDLIDTLTCRILEEAIKKAGKQIRKEAELDYYLCEMGTTIVSCMIFNNKLYFGSLGDSRLYLIRDNILSQLTIDHNIYQSEIDKGRSPEAIDEDEKNGIFYSSQLTRALMGTDTYEPEMGDSAVSLLPGDKILLCSDGLYSMVREEEILSIITENNGTKAVDLLIKKANINGGDDNITVILAETVRRRLNIFNTFFINKIF